LKSLPVISGCGRRCAVRAANIGTLRSQNLKTADPVLEKLTAEERRLRRATTAALADEALDLKDRLEAIKEEAIRRGLSRGQGVRGRITLSPPSETHRTDRDVLLQVLGITEAEFVSRFTVPVKTDWQMRVHRVKTARDRAAAA
jgi:hypothetical protein